jgi:polygalacturonase
MKLLALRTALLALALIVPAAAATYDVRNYGAKADGTTNDAPAFQAAIDACAAAGGGTVLVPAGRYLSGTVRFRSHVTFRLENGALLQASARLEDYAASDHVEKPTDNNRYLLVADDQEFITFEGEGTIRGIGQADLARRKGAERQPMPAFRIGTLLFRNCRDVALRDLTIRDSDFWTLHFLRCDRLRLRGLSILNNFYHTNSDGIDPVSCRDVFISDCLVVAGDDALCIKSDPGRACEQIVVTNCIFESVSAAIKIGTATHADIRDVRISNCTIRNSNVGVGIFIKDGGVAERVTFSNLAIRTQENPAAVNDSLQNRSYPLFIDVEQRNERSRIGGVRQMAFRDIQIQSDNGILFQGMPESPLHDVSLQNVSLTVDRAHDFAGREKAMGYGGRNPQDGRFTLYARKPSYVTLAHVDGLRVDNVQVHIADEVFARFPRAAVAVFESTRAQLQGISRLPGGNAQGEPVLTLENCRDVLVTGNRAAAATAVFLGVRGARSAEIEVAGNFLRRAAKAVALAPEVNAQAVTVP